MKQFLIFDLDDTLIPSSEIYRIALRKIGLKESGSKYQSARSKVKKRVTKGYPSARNRCLYFKAILEKQRQFSASKVLDLNERYEKALYYQVRKYWLKSKRDKILRTLSKKYTLAILTNENLRTQMLKLKAIDPKGTFFKTVMTSEEAGCEKPQKKVFELLLKELGNPKPHAITLVGDDFNNDIQPALKRKWSTVLTSEFVKPSKSQLPKVNHIKHLNELLEVLK